jgi:hypothetical protein
VISHLLTATDTRPISAVPWPVKLVLAVAVIAQLLWQSSLAPPTAAASALSPPADVAWFRVASLGEPIATAQMLLLRLQAFDNQPGISLPYRDLDYDAVLSWLHTALALDPDTEYPLMMAAHLYSQVPDTRKQRQMLEFVHQQFLRDPEMRWRWLAHAAIVAKHRLNDLPLALAYAEDIVRHARHAQSWARQMRIFILEDMGEKDAAAVLLGGLLATDEVKDDAERHFLMQRLEALRSAEKSSNPSEFR